MDKSVYTDPEVRLALVHHPYGQFGSIKAFILSVDDETYPYVKDESAWHKELLFDIVHNGLEIWIADCLSLTIIMDKDGYWELLTSPLDKRGEDPQYVAARIRMIGRIPFEDIVDIVPNGDEYGNNPHLFCYYKYEHGPYKEIDYRIEPGQGIQLPT